MERLIFELKIDTQDDAVQGDALNTVRRALSDSLQKLTDGYDAFPLRDINGNRMGECIMRVEDV